jgi:hypothetical protein
MSEQYRFSVKKSSEIEIETIFKITTSEEMEIIDDYVYKIINLYNLEFPDCLNYITLEERKKKNYIIVIDIGYNGEDGIDFILKSFNRSELLIEKITVG